MHDAQVCARWVARKVRGRDIYKDVWGGWPAPGWCFSGGGRHTNTNTTTQQVTPLPSLSLLLLSISLALALSLSQAYIYTLAYLLSPSLPFPTTTATRNPGAFERHIGYNTQANTHTGTLITSQQSRFPPSRPIPPATTVTLVLPLPSNTRHSSPPASPYPPPPSPQ